MARIHFEMVSFLEEKDTIVARLYQLFEVRILKEEFGIPVSAEKNSLILTGMTEEEGRECFQRLFNNHLNELKSTLTKKPVTFIHRSSGIPLMGDISFGIVDRGTNMIEVKPITGCNINCIFCSVDEGITSRKCRDYVVEREYIVQELGKILSFKGEAMDIWINTQGEPMLYAEIIPLIQDIKNLNFANKIALITNGTLLSKEFINAVKKAGLKQLNVSINAIDHNNGKLLAGTNSYNGTRVQTMVEQAIGLMDVVIAPVYLKGVNEKDIEEIIKFAQRIGCKKVHVQNFLSYKNGRNPIKQSDWDAFKRWLCEMQAMYPEVELFAKHHTLKHTKPLPKVLRKGYFVEAIIVAPGRHTHEMIAAANGRCITVQNTTKNLNDRVKIQITGDKDNIFYGKEK